MLYPLSYTMKDIVLMGIQWSGKWVQGGLLLKKFTDTFVCFEAGKILRALQSNDRLMCKNCGATLSMKIHDCTKCTECGSENIYQRTDDQELSSIKKRIELYNEVTRPVIDYFETLGVVKHVNGNQDIESVFADILKIIQE